MRATGISRSIDSLGRIVIPKEIRKNMRIRESDLLEFYAGDEGELILRKYSPMGELVAFAKEYAESLNQVSGFVSLITDRDQVIAAAGGCKDALTKRLSVSLQQKMEERQVVLFEKGDKCIRPFLQTEPQTEAGQENIMAFGMAPILCQGDVVGSVILVAKNENKKMGDIEKKLLQAAATFLGRQMELN